jgi:hypothetical protein
MNGQIAIGPARPKGQIHDIAADFVDVPKPVLRTVFGKHLGRRIWELVRGSEALDGRSSQPGAPTAATELANAEILRGMIGYLSRRGAETLEQNQRQASAVSITLTYVDGIQKVARARIARPTTDPLEICEAATTLFRTLDPCDAALESVNLTTSTLQAESVVEVPADLSCALAGAQS